MRVTTGKITSIVLAIVMLVVLFQILPSVIPLGSTAVHNLSDSLSGQGATIGTSAASFAGQIDDLTGWFWVIDYKTQKVL